MTREKTTAAYLDAIRSDKQVIKVGENDRPEGWFALVVQALNGEITEVRVYGTELGWWFTTRTGATALWLDESGRPDPWDNEEETP